MSFKVEIPCACCGGEVQGSADPKQLGNKRVCSSSCQQIHQRHYRDAVNRALCKIYNDFYG